MIPTITRGDIKPALTITISDARDTANFGAVAKSAVRVVGEMDGIVVFNDEPDEYTPSPDGKSATLKREWRTADTDEAGRMWVSVIVTWPTASPQTFPDDGPIRIDIGRAPGDL